MFFTHSFPCLPKILQEKLHSVCFPKLSLASNFHIPRFTGSSILTDECDVLGLACVDTRMQGSWHRLYSTNHDGRSFYKIIFKLIGYEGPTCVVIRSTCGIVLGAFCNDPWKDPNRFHGSRDNFLFTLYPNLQIYKTTSRDTSFQWLNSRNGLHGIPQGIGFGGSRDTAFRLFIPESLEECHAIGSDLTYETGPFLPKAYMGKFELDTLEIWGTGGDDLVNAGLRGHIQRREIIDENISRARKVDKAQFANSSFDQEFLLSKTFAHKVNVADDFRPCD